jgi:hypothetical protein
MLGTFAANVVKYVVDVEPAKCTPTLIRAVRALWRQLVSQGEASDGVHPVSTEAAPWGGPGGPGGGRGGGRGGRGGDELVTTPRQFKQLGVYLQVFECSSPHGAWHSVTTWWHSLASG